jgi:hypothetical protein
MKVEVIGESDYLQAFFGLGLSYGLTADLNYFEFVDSDEKEILRVKLHKVADKLAPKDTGENKFLESLVVWLDIIAPRYWWQQFDTYRIGVSKQSESTMHMLLHRKLYQNDFEHAINPNTLQTLNEMIENRNFDGVKNLLPEGFLQRRVVTLNYKVLRHMYQQRRNHKLKEWQYFFLRLGEDLNFPLYIMEEIGDYYE